MQRRGGVWWFRVRVPKELAGLPAPAHVRATHPELVNAKTGSFKREITSSLQTTERREAAQRNGRKTAQTLRAFSEAMRLLQAGPPAAITAAFSLPTPEELEEAVYASALAQDDAELESEDERLSDPNRAAQREAFRSEMLEAASPKLRAVLEADPDVGLASLELGRGRQEDAHIALGEMLREEEAELRQALSRGRPSIVEGDVKGRLKAYGVRYDPANGEHHSLALAVLRGTLKGVQARLSRLEGNVVRTPKPLSSTKGPKLSEALTRWEAGSGARGGRKPSDGSVREARLAVRRFSELHGDLPLGCVTPGMARAFRDALEAVPIRLTERERSMTLKALLQADLAGRERTHGATVNKQLTLLKAVVSHAERNGAFDELASFRNPFRGVSSEIDERQAERRNTFSEADLKAIFGTPIYSAGDRPAGGGREAAFWFPVLALLTGCRLGELAQLRVCDVAEEEGVWRLDIGTSGRRKVKTASSRRKVPLHPALVTIGFLRYRESRLEAGGLEADLWPAVRSAAGRDRGASFSQWFGRHLRKVALVTDPYKVFHSFRHSFVRLARDAGLSEEMQDALTGHLGGGVGRTYGAGFGLRTLAEGIAKIEAPAPVMALRWGPNLGRGGSSEVTSAEGSALSKD